MGNLNRGEVSAQIAGTEYILRIATNEWCYLENELGMPTDEIIADFIGMLSANKLKMGLLRSLFRAALIGRKPELTKDQAGELMSGMGLVEAGGLLAQVIKASMPEESESAPTHPRKAVKAA